MTTVVNEPFHLVEGTGAPAIVLVHGAMCDLTNWDGIVPQLAEQHTVVRMDLGGHGRTPGEPTDAPMQYWAAQLIQLIERLDLGPVILTGHSLGSRIATVTAGTAPHLVAGLVLIDGMRYEAGSIPRQRPPEDRRSSFDINIGPHANDEVRALVRASIARSDRGFFKAVGPALQQWDAVDSTHAYAALPADMPVLAIQSTVVRPPEPRRPLLPGEDDGPFLQFLRGAVPQVEIRIVAGTGHFPMLEKPGEVGEMILAFAERCGA